MDGGAAATSLDCGVNACRGVDCGGSSECIVQDEDFVCKCAPGYVGGGAGQVCKGVQCPAIPAVPHSTHTASTHEGRFPGTVLYKCNAGNS